MFLRQRGSWAGQVGRDQGAFWVAPYRLALAPAYILYTREAGDHRADPLGGEAK